MGLLGAVRRHAYGALGYRNQKDDSLGVLTVQDEGSYERCLQEWALYRALRVWKCSSWLCRGLTLDTYCTLGMGLTPCGPQRRYTMTYHVV
jgi:hypothetical protein